MGRRSNHSDPGLPPKSARATARPDGNGSPRLLSITMVQRSTAALERYVDDGACPLDPAQAIDERAIEHFSGHSKARKLPGVFERQRSHQPASGSSEQAPPVPPAGPETGVGVAARRLEPRITRSSPARVSSVLLLSGASLLLASCNALVGGGVVALMGGAGYLAAQCYDRVRVRVRDTYTGEATCGADVWLSDADGSKRRLRSCYSAALTEGTWTLTAVQQGYTPASTQVTIPEHKGGCPTYTHSIELTLRRVGEPATPAEGTRSRTASDAPAAPPPGAASELESPPARIVPPPIPGGSSTPVIPTRSFEPIPVAPATPTPAPAPAPAPDPAAPR